MMRKSLYLFLFLASLQLNAGAVAVDTTNGFTAPAGVSGNVKTLAYHLCEGEPNDTLKANLLFNWVTHNIALDVKANKDPDRPEDDLSKILKEKKTTVSGYALLYKELCKAVGMDAVTIQGYGKSWIFDDGDNFYLPNDEWCAVMIDRRWQLVHPAMGAGYITRLPAGWLRNQLNKISKEKVIFSKKEEFVFSYTPEYFLIDPLVFRFQAVPADPLWQLCKTHIPLEVFEAGNDAVASFNDANGDRISRSAELEYIARLNEQQVNAEMADRAYKFNDSFEVALARKEVNAAVEAVEKYAARRHIPPRATYEEAYRGVVRAAGHIKKQKGYIPGHYAALKKKNTAKNKAATDHIREVRTKDKMLMAQLRIRRTGAERKLEGLDDKYEKVEEKAAGTDTTKLYDIQTVSNEKDKTSPMLQRIADSVNAKQQRVTETGKEISQVQDKITLLQLKNSGKLATLVQNMVLADTILGKETLARLAFNDDYDHIIRQYTSLFAQVRFMEGDSLQKKYLQNFDTLVSHYEDLQKLFRRKADLYRGIMRELVQYRRWNTTEKFVDETYRNAVDGYNNTVAQALKLLDEYKVFLNEHIAAFKQLDETYEFEMDLLKRMEEAEAARKEAEDTALEEHQHFYERTLDRLQQSADGLQAELTKILTQ